MKTLMKIAAVSALLTQLPAAFAQDWHAAFPSGNPITSTEWLGCDGTSTQPLRIKTMPDYAIDLYTSDIRRFSLLPDNTYATLGAYSSVVADGYSLHSPDVAAFFAGGAPGPYSLEHVAAATNSSFQDAYRDWARTGTTYTGGGTMGYFGLKEGGKSHTDLVVQLAKRDGETAPDRIRFIFTDLLNGSSPNGADSQEGLEGMRLTAVSNTRVNVGFGDYTAIGGEPTEAVDVGAGKVRVRQLPSDAVSTSDEVVTVNMTTGVLEHRPLPTGCEWYRNTAPTHKYVLSGTANPGSGLCPDRAWRYGIGTTTPGFKFDVQHNDNDRLNTGGINSSYIVNQPATQAYGMQSTVAGSYFTLGYGLRASVVGAGYAVGVEGGVNVNSSSIVNGQAWSLWGRLNHSAGTLSKGHGTSGEVLTNGGASVLYGTYGNAYGYGSSNVGAMYGAFGRMQLYSGTVTNGYGVSGISFTNSGSLTNSYGLYGHAYAGVNNYSVYGALPAGGAVNWSGFFVGPISASGVSLPSDMNLKAGIQDLDDPVGMLMRLRPRSYSYRREEFPQMGLPEGQRYGFLAQEVQQVFPQFVTPSHQPQGVDSLGNEISAAVDYLALSTSDIIPLLVGAVQQQHTSTTEAMATQTGEMEALRAQLEEQRARLDQLEQLLAACCANPDGSRMQPPANTTEPALYDHSDDRRLRVVPNPVNESTTVYYTLDKGGRTQLMANSADGREFRVLQDAHLEVGDHQFQWNTASLAPGVYYVTLLLDGQPVVKKAVKL